MVGTNPTEVFLLNANCRHSLHDATVAKSGMEDEGKGMEDMCRNVHVNADGWQTKCCLEQTRVNIRLVM
jgi:hypothetical protein